MSQITYRITDLLLTLNILFRLSPSLVPIESREIHPSHDQDELNNNPITFDKNINVIPGGLAAGKLSRLFILDDKSRPGPK